MTKVSRILPLDETIHIPSILDELITSLYKFFKNSSRLKDPESTVGGGGFSSFYRPIWEGTTRKGYLF